MLSNVQSQYRKVTQETPKNPEVVVQSYFQLSLSVISSLMTARNGDHCPRVMIQLEAFLTPLLATVLQLKEHLNQCLPNQTLSNQSNFIQWLQQITMSNNINLHKCSFLLTSFPIFSCQIGFYNKVFLGNMALLIRSYHGKMNTMTRS